MMLMLVLATTLLSAASQATTLGNKFEVERYLCKSECDVTRKVCSCRSNCVSQRTCCSDYESSCLGAKRWVEKECSNISSCPNGFAEPPLILFSIDGFKAEYLYREKTPNIWKLSDCGVHAPYMRAAYPTKTFPNHHTIATGLYPESHGIVDKKMFDHVMKKEFFINANDEEALAEARNPEWWGGEPIWVTSSRQNTRSACLSWPGCDVDFGVRQEIVSPKYDPTVPNEERMHQALSWLDLPVGSRPRLIILYMEIVDTVGHTYGPDSEKTDQALAEADRMVEILMNGLQFRGLENCVNLILLADHGMSERRCDHKASVEDYGLDLKNLYFRDGAFGRIGKSTNPTEWYQFDAEAVHKMLRCTHETSHWKSFLSYEYLPKRFHYANNRRIDPVNLVVDDGWVVEGKKGSYSSCEGGTHGFDNEFKSMHALFAAHGPGFKRKFNSTEPFEAIEVYNMMTNLLGLNPAPNNGTHGSLNHIMALPSPVPTLPVPTNPEVCQEFNRGNVDASCQACESFPDFNLTARLQLDASQISSSQRTNMPYGRPHVSPAGRAQLTDDVSYCMLTQVDYVMAYDKIKNSPFYASFTLEKKVRKAERPEDCIRPDPRIPAPSVTCQEFEDDPLIEPVGLYNGEFSNDDAFYEATILSNQVPMYKPAATVWKYMAKQLAKWADAYNGVNVVAGPAYDYDYDGIADSHDVLARFGKFLNHSDSTPIPTHYYLVVTRCKEMGSTIMTCQSPLSLEVLSFIIPNYSKWPCGKDTQSESQWVPETLLEHVARIRDVELITGISFMTSFTHEDTTDQEDRVSAIRVKLRLPQFSSQWLADFSTAAAGRPCQRFAFLLSWLVLSSTLLGVVLP